MKPEIYAKSSLTKEQADVKLCIGCDGLEIQLLGELINDHRIGDYKAYESVFDLDKFRAYPVRVVHMPLVPKMGDVLLEAMVDAKDVSLLIEVFRIAQRFAEMQGHPVGIVVHSESFYEKLVDEDVWQDLVAVVNRLLTVNQGTYLLLENVSPLRGIGKGKQLHLANNFAFDNVEMVRMLRISTGCNRIFTCLDTCHAMLADKYISLLYDSVGDVPKEDLSMRRYFDENKNVIGLIHLSTVNGSGYGKGRHGVPFTEERYSELSEILSLYEEFGYTCPITLEVEEIDYSVCGGYAMTKELVDHYFSRG